MGDPHYTKLLECKKIMVAIGLLVRWVCLNDHCHVFFPVVGEGL